MAAGRTHAYWHLDLRIWEVAAASVILRRAGGTLTDTLGNAWQSSAGGYIASNGIIHDWTVRSIQQVLDEARLSAPVGRTPLGRPG